METVNVKIIPDDANKVIRRELISLGLALTVSVLIVLVQRKVSDPDFVLTCRMKALNGVARYADNKAYHWKQISDKATRLYLESR